MNTHQDTVDKVAKLRAELAEEEAKLAAYNEMTDAQKLAEDIHGRNCTWNHTDGCSWFYEKNWTDWTHARYLRRAEHLLQRHNLADVLDILAIEHENLD